MGDWEAFYAAQLGAAAALGGLVFVGLSLNLKKILSYVGFRVAHSSRSWC